MQLSGESQHTPHRYFATKKERMKQAKQPIRQEISSPDFDIRESISMSVKKEDTH